MKRRAWIIGTIGLAAAAAAWIAVPAARGGESAEPRSYEAWVPPGEYSAFVFTTSANANTRRWVVTIRTATGGSYPVSIGPAETVTVPFEKGWKVRAEDEVRVRSVYVPFDDMRDYNPLNIEGPMLISAWGVTPGGPVTFVPPKKNTP